MCKGNSVHTVNRKMSEPAGFACAFTANDLATTCHASHAALGTQKELDNWRNRNIIIFTAHGRPTAVQTIISSPDGYAESSSPRRPARDFSEQRLLRSGRLAAGEVRDAAGGGSRQATGQPGSKGVRRLASVVLSGAGSLSRSWSSRTVATQTRATVRAQADRGAYAVCGTTPSCRAGDLQSSAGRANRTTLQRLGSPAQHRPSTAASKKTPVSPEPAAISLADRRLVVASEELRWQAAEGWRRGPGLALLMARGFHCGMKACSQLLANECSRTQALDSPKPARPSGLRGELIILLASRLLHRVSKEIA